MKTHTRPLIKPIRLKYNFLIIGDNILIDDGRYAQ